MLKANCIVLYKNTCAALLKAEGVKWQIKFPSAASKTGKLEFSVQSVREKDFSVLCEESATSLEAALKFAESCPQPCDRFNTQQTGEVFCQIKECHELLVQEGEMESVPFADLVSLFRGELKADEAWGLYCALKNTLFFEQTQLSPALTFAPRSTEEIASLVAKNEGKQREAAGRAAFIARLKTKRILPEDSLYMGDVEALAQGKSDKSRTMKEAGFKESPERAHKLLLDTGVWPITRNPYPLRWGLSMKSAKEPLPAPPDEARLELDTVAWAIDDEYSSDPDDAVCFDGEHLWVHVADPAAAVLPGSAIDKAARERGATLYLPEGAARMLDEASLADYALGLSGTSCALSFRLALNDDGTIGECAVFKTLLHVKRLTYAQADAMKEGDQLRDLFSIARRNAQRREAAGAVQIELPEVRVCVEGEDKRVSIQPISHGESGEMVREMMLLAGEGAARFAFKHGIPFPYVSQEAPDIPEALPTGLARQFRLRRCMKKRSVGVTPAMHHGLGLAMYSQVTSPLRRYGDLAAHMQLRAFIDSEESTNTRAMRNKDELLLAVSEGDAGYQAARKAESKSTLHWKLVYLMQNPTWRGEAVCVATDLKQPLFSIPSLAMETFIGEGQGVALNESVTVRVARIDLAELLVEFAIVS